MLAQIDLVTAQTDEEYTSESGKSIFDQFLRAAVDASFADCDKTSRTPCSNFETWCIRRVTFPYFWCHRRIDAKKSIR